MTQRWPISLCPNIFRALQFKVLTGKSARPPVSSAQLASGSCASVKRETCFSLTGTIPAIRVFRLWQH